MCLNIELWNPQHHLRQFLSHQLQRPTPVNHFIVGLQIVLDFLVDGGELRRVIREIRSATGHIGDGFQNEPIGSTQTDGVNGNSGIRRQCQAAVETQCRCIVHTICQGHNGPNLSASNSRITHQRVNSDFNRVVKGGSSIRLQSFDDHPQGIPVLNQCRQIRPHVAEWNDGGCVFESREKIEDSGFGISQGLNICLRQIADDIAVLKPR